MMLAMGRIVVAARRGSQVKHQTVCITSCDSRCHLSRLTSAFSLPAESTLCVALQWREEQARHAAPHYKLWHSDSSAVPARMRERGWQLKEYKRMQLFLPPSEATMRPTEIFLQLQLASQIEIDLREFLITAKHAFKIHLELANSVEFAKFLSASSTGGKREYESTANALKALCWPECYQLLEQYRRNLPTQRKRDYRIVVRGAFVHGAGYRPRTEVFREDDWSASQETTAEQMAITVRIRAMETYRNLGKKKKEVKHKSEFACSFLSRVAYADGVDWRIAGVSEYLDPA